ncbi:MAG TPA: methylamine utilization protein [Thermoanaerobaculia bacterium]|nr:methylamine utilization protein [Thermoanaerobaculia bacterium]
MRPLLGFVFAAAVSVPLAAATLDVRVQDARGAGVKDAVVYAILEGRPAAPARNRTAVMDQKNRTFIPHVLPVQTGTKVTFPNSDDIRHHVYSFSPAKPFQLPLYKGTPATPELFDRAGVVTLGCNIHDQMSAYIVIVDTPHFAKTPAGGKTTLSELAGGRYTVRVWYPDMREEPKAQSITVSEDGRASLTFVAGRGPAATHMHGHP